ncbi:lipopolysaccharide-induced tumor necrosis factor-alpha factor homolog [Coccinella septempunctata]|uniref:lipopolysaccharide-induced tumor necrosis factor-alpha factor homolog n=1 Tax=Coccinella septempunctata TaxID=41139 RepID=UPI001D066284|nr:lipopolysaccharide-induced tumor necrosis factor-alpha factor homolog [Coccinella septempunctata]
MNKEYGNSPPPYHERAPPSAPPSYAEALRGVPPSSPYVAQNSFTKGPEIVTTVVPIGPNPTHMICPHCHAEIITTTKSRPSAMAYITGALICILGCPLGCCLIPCCLKKCRDIHHNCPNCDAYLGGFMRNNISLNI